MGHAQLAVEMLTTAGELRAAEIAEYLETKNRERQAMERSIVAEAIAQIESQAAPDDRAIIVGDPGWHPGVIGIVASRLVDRYHKPAIVISLNTELAQGSGRSISGFHLARGLRVCTEYLTGHGGHEMAAGLKLEPGKFAAFRQAFLEHAAQAITPEMLVRELQLDVAAELGDLTEALILDVKRLGPFGMGNRRPIVHLPAVELAAPPRRVGKTGDHLQMYVRQGRTSMKCIAFGAGNLCDQLKAGMTLQLAVEPQLNEFNGRTSVELEIKALALA